MTLLKAAARFILRDELAATEAAFNDITEFYVKQIEVIDEVSDQIADDDLEQIEGLADLVDELSFELACAYDREEQLTADYDALHANYVSALQCFDALYESAETAWAMAYAPRWELLLRGLTGYRPLLESEGKFW